MQYFLDKLKEFLVLTAGEKKSPLTFLLCKCKRTYYERNVI